jgi:hypothetical protein
MPSWHPLTRCRPRCAILAALVGTRRLSGHGQPRASFRRCRKGKKRESGRESAQPGPGLPGPVAGRSRMPSWHPLTRCRPRCAILAALVGTRRLSGHGQPRACRLSRRRSRQSVCSGLRSPGEARLRASGGRTVAGAPACASAYGRRAKPGSAHAVVAPWQRRRHLLRLMLAKQTPGSMQAMRAPWRLHSQSLRVAARRRSAAAAVARMCDRSAFEPHLGCGSECPSENRQDAGVSRVFSRASRPLRAVRGCRCR